MENNYSLNETSNRVFLFDLLRGLAIILMIIHHTLFDLCCVFGFSPLMPVFNLVDSISWIGGWTFVSVSGACVVFSHSPEKRGARLFVMGTAISLVTLIFIPSEIIICDVLCLLGFCMMVYSVTERFINKIPFYIGIPVFALLFALTFNISKGYLGIKNIFTIPLKYSLYQSDSLCFFGFYSKRFYSANYWPIFPMIFLFFASIYIGKAAKNKKFPSFSYKSLCRPLEYVGKHSLVIYILHQPIVYGISWIFFKLF